MSTCVAEPPVTVAPLTSTSSTRAPRQPAGRPRAERMAPFSLDKAYETSFAPLVAFVMRISNCGHQAAEDIVQDVFLRIVHAHREKFETLGSDLAQKAFLYQSARRRTVDWARHARLPVSRALSLSLLDSSSDPHEHPQAATARAELEHMLAECHESDVANVVIYRELLQAALTAALDKMNYTIGDIAARREAIALALIEGATVADLCDYLAYAGVAAREPRVKALVYRARIRIRAALAEVLADDTDNTPSNTVRAKRREETESRDILHLEDHQEDASSDRSSGTAATYARLRTA